MRFGLLFTVLSLLSALLYLQDAVYGDHKEVASLLIANGARVMDKEGDLVELSDSHLSLNLRHLGEVAEDWEIDPQTIKFICQIGNHQSAVCQAERHWWFLLCTLWHQIICGRVKPPY